MNDNFHVLVLDGGGSKGVYTLGVLNELEKKIGKPLGHHFDLIYGTSTGSIIAALLASGKKIQDIKQLYFENIPQIMGKWGRKRKTLALKELADRVMGDITFENLKTDIGIVAINYDKKTPLIFKSNLDQAHGMTHSFVAGFGCNISDAVQASCSAYPIFSKKIIETSNQGEIIAVDGGYIANNATLYSIIDAVQAFKVDPSRIKVLSVGTGAFPEKPINLFHKYLMRLNFLKFTERIFVTSTNSNVQLTKLIYGNIDLVRINGAYTEREYRTNMVEKDPKKLKKLFDLGRDCFSEHEGEIENLLS